MAFPQKIKEEAMVACGRHCCLCHKFCGIKIETHHIVPTADGGDNSYDNAIPLCFDCHADMRSYDYKHPKGTKYTSRELKKHRDNWYEKISGNIGIANRAEILDTDKKVYLALIKFLPWDGSINFLRKNNFAGWTFKLKELDDLDEFIYNCKNPAFEFIDPDLEALRVKLLEKTNRCLSLIAKHTFPTNTPGFNAVPEEWEIEQPERFYDVIKEIHEANDNVCESYDELVRTATRKLGVLPENFA